MSTPAKHTPWRVEKSPSGDELWGVFDARGAYVFSSADEGIVRLFAAAPAMLEALDQAETALDYVHRGSDDPRISRDLAVIRAALALATPVLEREG